MTQPVSSSNAAVKPAIAAGVATGAVAAGVKYHQGTKQLASYLENADSFISSSAKNSKYAGKIQKGVGKAVDKLTNLQDRMQNVAEAANKKARDLKVNKLSSVEARQAKNIADNDAKTVNIVLKGIKEKIADIPSLAKEVGKKVNIKQAAAAGAITAAVVGTGVVIANAVKNKIQANKAVEK